MPQREIVITSEDCPECGDQPIVKTTAPQGCPCKTEAGIDNCGHTADWWAYDGDPVVCLDCGAKGSIVADGDPESGAYVRWDDDA